MLRTSFTTGFGAVAAPYRISKFEITTAQYAEFLNAVAATDSNGLYNTTMGVIGFRVAAGPEPGVPAQDFFTIDPAQSFLQIASTSVFTLDFMGVVMALDLHCAIVDSG